MSWTECLVARHTLWAHASVTIALLLPLPLIAAQRQGRGIKPWWVTARFLIWSGVLFGFLWTLSEVSGGSHAQSLDTMGAHGPSGFRLYFMLASLLLGLVTLRCAYLKRQDHQGLGVRVLGFGLLWCISVFILAHRGHPDTLAPQPAPLVATPIAPANTQQAKGQDIRISPRILDYLSLEPMHREPVKSLEHGGRWIRVWANDVAASAYREGRELPGGSLAVMSTREDRWGRPSFEDGPLYALERSATGHYTFTLYWPRVPAERRQEVEGAASVYWHGDTSHLQSCMACHAQGAAPLAKRSAWRVPKVRLKTIQDAETPGTVAQ